MPCTTLPSLVVVPGGARLLRTVAPSCTLSGLWHGSRESAQARCRLSVLVRGFVPPMPMRYDSGCESESDCESESQSDCRVSQSLAVSQRVERERNSGTELVLRACVVYCTESACTFSGDRVVSTGGGVVGVYRYGRGISTGYRVRLSGKRKINHKKRKREGGSPSRVCPRRGSPPRLLRSRAVASERRRRDTVQISLPQAPPAPLRPCPSSTRHAHRRVGVTNLRQI